MRSVCVCVCVCVCVLRLFFMWTIFKDFFEFLTMLLLIFMGFCLFFGHNACGVLAPQSGIDTYPYIGRQILTIGPPEKSPEKCLQLLILEYSINTLLQILQCIISSLFSISFPPYTHPEQIKSQEEQKKDGVFCNSFFLPGLYSVGQLVLGLDSLKLLIVRELEIPGRFVHFSVESLHQ